VWAFILKLQEHKMIQFLKDVINAKANKLLLVESQRFSISVKADLVRKSSELSKLYEELVGKSNVAYDLTSKVRELDEQVKEFTEKLEESQGERNKQVALLTFRKTQIEELELDNKEYLDKAKKAETLFTTSVRHTLAIVAENKAHKADNRHLKAVARSMIKANNSGKTLTATMLKKLEALIK
jgi:hypothetical protein